MPGVTDKLHAVFRAAIACALTLGGVALFVMRFEDQRLLLPAFLILLGVMAFTGAVARPLSGVSNEELMGLYLPTKGDKESSEKQRRLFTRLSIVFFALGFLWLAFGIVALLVVEPNELGVLGRRPVVGVTVGSALLMGIGSLAVLAGWVARLWSLVAFRRSQGRRDSERP